MQFAYITLIGFAAGLLGGALGVGGGVLIVPALVLLFKQPYQTAVGTSLMVIIPIALAGALRHHTLGNTNISLAAAMAIGGMIGAFGGATIIQYLPALLAKRAFAIFLIYVAVRLWFEK
jgi:uncharacterized membrane protein YfcA